MAGSRERARAPSASPARGASSAPAFPSSTASRTGPVRVFPPSAASARALQALPADASSSVAAIGILGAGRASAAVALANRVIGRLAFRAEDLEGSGTKRSTAPASIHLFYDASRRCVYLLGLSHASAAVDSSLPACGDVLAPSEAAEAEHERLKMQTLLFASCSLVFVLRSSARTTTHELKRVRALAAEKAQLLQWLGASSSSSSSSSSSTSSTAAAAASGSKGSKRSPTTSLAQALSPGRCVPVVVFIVPAANDALLTASVAARPPSAGGSARSATAAYCKAAEARLAMLFRSLRGGPVGSARVRDALSPANLSKERRVFSLDPSHSVVVVSRRALGGPEARLRAVLDAASDSETESEGEDTAEALLAPLEDDAAGWPRALQLRQRVLDHVLAAGAAKDARAEPLPLPQWLRAFQTLAKLYQRMDSRRRSEAAAAGGGVSAGTSA